MIKIISLIITVFLISCSKSHETGNNILDNIAEHYVKLVLATGEYDEDYVDAYFGPEEWKTEALSLNLSIEQIKNSADSLVGEFDNVHTGDFSSIEMQRMKFLKRQIESLSSKSWLLMGNKMSFDEESQALFDAVAPSYTDEKYQTILAELEKLIPGNGDLDERFIEYKKQFLIPEDKIDTIFKTVIAEGKRRTKEHINLPEDEKFILEFVSDKSWGGYNWFKGNATSLIQVNTDLPKYIDGALGLACHEGYPGHHVYHSLIEENFVNKNGWMEFSVYPLFSPEALISEGTANYGIEVAFPADEKKNYEKEVLFPLAGISTEKADEYYKIQDLVRQLDYATVDIARSYLDGKINREDAINKLMKFKLRSKEHAEKNINFFDAYRSYIINYYIGEELCRQWVETRLENGSNDKRWQIFNKLLSHPYLPGDLTEEKD
jgi:hypothetical protein